MILEPSSTFIAIATSSQMPSRILNPTPILADVSHKNPKFKKLT